MVTWLHSFLLHVRSLAVCILTNVLTMHTCRDINDENYVNYENVMNYAANECVGPLLDLHITELAIDGCLVLNCFVISFLDLHLTELAIEGYLVCVVS